MRKVRFNLDVQSNALLCPNPEEWYAKAYIKSNVADNFRAIPGVKETTKISVNNFTKLLKPAGCQWAPVDTVLDAEEIDVCKLDAMVQICQYDVEESFISAKMAAGDANWAESDFLDHFWNDVANEIEQEIQDIRWNGNTAGSTASYLHVCDGYQKNITSASYSTLVPGFGASASSYDVITKDNIVAILDKVVSALPEAVKGLQDEVRIYMSAGNAYKYLAAVLNHNYDFNYTGDLPLVYAGYKISVQPGMNEKFITAGRREQFAFAFDGIDDDKNIKIVNMIDTTAEPVLRARVGLKIGFKILAQGAGITYYLAS
jgi:hypothetical protein